MLLWTWVYNYLFKTLLLIWGGLYTEVGFWTTQFFSQKLEERLKRKMTHGHRNRDTWRWTSSQWGSRVLSLVLSLGFCIFSPANTLFSCGGKLASKGLRFTSSQHGNPQQREKISPETISQYYTAKEKKLTYCKWQSRKSFVFADILELLTKTRIHFLQPSCYVR